MRRLVLLGLIALVPGCGEAAPPPAPAAEPVDWTGLEAGWTEFPAPPYSAACAVSVWTGRELLYWGGDDSCHEGTPRDEGASFDPVTHTWHALPRAPIDGRSSPAAVWTGEELLVWGGWSGGVRNDGAAYRPAADEWQVLAPGPLNPNVPTAAVWTGEEMLVWDGPDGAAYEPESETWRELALSPFAMDRAHAVWTGREMIVYGMALDRDNQGPDSEAAGLAYDPAEDSWREIAPFGLSPNSSMVVWTGREMVAWDYELRAGAYDPASDAWRKLPGLPLDFYECYADGAVAGEGFVLAWHCGEAAILELATDTWRELPRPPSSIAGDAVAADGVVLFAGAWPPGASNPLWAYRPGPFGTTAFVPHTQRRGERDYLPLTFPDGTRLVFSYPVELSLGGMTVEPNVSYLYRADRPPRFELQFVFGPAEPRRDQIAFRTRSWTIVADLRDDREAALISDSLEVRETAEGFPVVEARDPIALSDESGEGLGPNLQLALAADRWIELWLEPNCGRSEPEISSDYGGACLGDVHVGVYAERPFVEAVFEGLRLEEG
jgi:hypothetical protein